MKPIRKIIKIDDERCDGCGNCVLACAEGAIRIIDGKAKVIADKYCDGLGACIGDCPQNALTIIEREADEFDEQAVEELLKQQKQSNKGDTVTACGCPSATIQTFPSTSGHSCACANQPQVHPAGNTASGLGHWPVQIRLVPAGAPFLKNADLVIAADCVPVAYPSFHADFLKGNAVMIGCPKFDNAEETIGKLAQVFKSSGIKSITSVVMEVPCCSALPGMIKKALAAAAVDIPFKTVVVGARGNIIS